MARQLPLVIALALVLGTGVVRARWTARRADTRDVLEAAARLENVPLNAGEWIGTAHPFDLREYAAAGIQGALMRTYKREGTDQEMTLLIVCGRPGAISVHTPDVCYTESGYDMLSKWIPVAVQDKAGAAPEHFWKLRMAKKDALRPENLNVTFGWSTDGRWQAPEREARFVFADAPVLFKLYAVRTVPPAIASQGEAVETDTDPTPEFLRALLPDLNRAVFPPPAPPAS